MYVWIDRRMDGWIDDWMGGIMGTRTYIYTCELSLFVSICVWLSVSLSVYVSACVSICLPDCMSVCMSILNLSVCIGLRVFVCVYCTSLSLGYQETYSFVDLIRERSCLLLQNTSLLESLSPATCHLSIYNA